MFKYNDSVPTQGEQKMLYSRTDHSTHSHAPAYEILTWETLLLIYIVAVGKYVAIIMDSTVNRGSGGEASMVAMCVRAYSKNM